MANEKFIFSFFLKKSSVVFLLFSISNDFYRDTYRNIKISMIDRAKKGKWGRGKMKKWKTYISLMQLNNDVTQMICIILAFIIHINFPRYSSALNWKESICKLKCGEGKQSCRDFILTTWTMRIWQQREISCLSLFCDVLINNKIQEYWWATL